MRGIPCPPRSHRPSPGRGQQRWRRLQQGDPPPRLPRPHPNPYLPAASRTARTARSCGPGGSWGPSSCGVSCPWRARELAREPKRSPTSPAAGPAAPGGRQRDARAATADAPSPSSATPPGSAANGRARGGPDGEAGPDVCPVGSAPQNLGDHLSRPAQTAPEKVGPIQRWGWRVARSLSPKATYLRTAVEPG